MSVEIPNARCVEEHDPGVCVALHPLVIVNLTDHFTRLNLTTPKNAPPRRAVGALYGQHHQKRIEIHTSFEVVYAMKKTSDGTEYVELDLEFMKKKKEQYTQVFADYDILGWYTTGAGLTKNDIARTHQSLIEEGGIESPLILIMDTAPGPNVKILPVYIFETLSQHSKGPSHSELRKIRYTVESEESERIGVDTAMKVDTAQDKNPTLVPTAELIGNAVLMLRIRIQIILAYLQDVKAGKLPPDFELLREIRCVCNKLPDPEGTSFTEALRKDYDDALMTTYLAMLSKTAALLSQVVDKSVIFSQKRRPMGPGMTVGFGIPMW